MSALLFVQSRDLTLSSLVRAQPVRLATSGKGEADPIASSDTESGRQANRRVEIYVEPVRAN